MKQTNRNRPILLASFAGIIGIMAAVTSLSHNIQGILPRITEMSGTWHYYHQWITEGGAAITLNIAALVGFTYASTLAMSKSYIKSAGFILVAIFAMVWSGATQLDVIAEKTFEVSGTKSTAMDLYNRALVNEKKLIAAMPSSHKFMGEAQQDVRTALAALRSHRYGNKTAWQTTNHCSGDITATASIALCKNYLMAVRALETSKHAADLDKRLVAVNAIIAKGQPATISAGPELIAGASLGSLSVKNVQVILVFLESFGIDMVAGIFLAGASTIWPTARPAPLNPAPSGENSRGGNDRGVNSRVHSSRVIADLLKPVQAVQTDEHAQDLVYRALKDCSEGGAYKTSYRALALASGVATGSMNEALVALTSKGLINRTSSKGRGTVGTIPALMPALIIEHA